jgi:hypothetical protein
MAMRQPGGEREQSRRHLFVVRADKQGIEASQAHELADELVGLAGDDDVLDTHPRPVQEARGLAHQALGRRAGRPGSRLAINRNQQRHADRVVVRALTGEPHQPVGIDVRVRGD